MADRKGFDLADLLKDVSTLATASDFGREQIEYIDIGLIDGDPGNFYKLTQLEELASNIAVVGLQQPLRVRISEADPQRVVVVSGHRRLAALKLLMKEGREDLRGVPCIREHTAGSAALQELRLIYANRDTRVISSWELAKQAERVEMLLYQLKEEGFEFPGRMRDHVAQACKISAPKLARLKVIRGNLIPEYMSLFEQDKLPEQTAYALARLPADFQRRMASALTAPPRGDIAEKVLAKYNKGWRWEPHLTCPDGKACKRGDVFLRRDCESLDWQRFCGGKTCCLKCTQATSYSGCSRMCSKAKAQQKEARDKEEEEAYKRRVKQGRKYQKETQVYAKRLLRAIDAAGVPEDTKINWRNYNGIQVSTIRQWAVGEFNSDPAKWYGVNLKPGTCYSDNLAGLAQLLNCSTDFLMGLTEDIRPPQAQEGPENPIEVLEDETASADSWDDISEVLAQVTAPEEPVRRIRWEHRGKTPPENKPILTYQMTNDGPKYRPAVWTGSKFKHPNRPNELTGLQYTYWLEILPPGCGECCEIVPPEQPEGQLMICGWMPGGTLPVEPCEVIADFQVDDDTQIREACIYDKGNFYFVVKGRKGAKIDAEIIRWMRLPPVEDDKHIVFDSNT